MFTIGITGGIACGKSSVTTFWSARFLLPSCDADAVCRQLLQKKEPGWRALHKEFGDRFFSTDGSLDRLALRTAIFSDRDCRMTVNRLLHPLARQAIRTWIASIHRTPVPPTTLLVEVPLLFEAGWHEDFDTVATVYAPPQQCRERLCRRDGVTLEQAEEALASQFPPEEKALLAHHVVDNGGPWWDTCLQLIHLGSLFSGKKLRKKA